MSVRAFAAKLAALRAAAQVGAAAIDRGDFDEFVSVDQLRDRLEETAARSIASSDRK